MRTLDEHYRTGRWRVPVLRALGADPFLVLVSTILSQRTRDEVTERSAISLLRAYPDANALARAPIPRLQALIRGVGLWRTKAKGLHDAARYIVEHFDGKVPESERELSEIPLVGPKTAHAIRVFAFRLSGIPVDTHILRVTRRLGAVKGNTILEAQRELARTVPKRYWHLLNPVLVQHGMNICAAHAPRCGVCPIARWCLRVGVATPGSHRSVDSGEPPRRPHASRRVPASFDRTRRERPKVD